MGITAEELRIIVRAETKRARDELDRFRRKGSQTTNDLKKMAKAMIGPLSVTAGIALLTRGAVGFVKAGIAFNASVETLTTSFETLLGSGAAAADMIRDLTTFSASTPLQLEGLAKGATQLIAFGSEAGSVIQQLENLGNAAMGNQVNLDRLVLAYGKVQAKGKATLQELNMFTEAGVPLMQELQRATGGTMDELFKLISAGKIGFKEVDDALTSLTTGEGMFAGMLEKQSQTLIGVTSTLKDNVKILAGTFTRSLLPALKNTATWLIKVAQEAQAAETVMMAIRKVRAGMTDTTGMAPNAEIAEMVSQREALVISMAEWQRQLDDGLVMGGNVPAYKEQIADLADQIEAIDKGMHGATRRANSFDAALRESKRALSEALASEIAETDRLIEIEQLFATEYKRTMEGAIQAKRQMIALIEAEGGDARALAILQKLNAELDALIEKQKESLAMPPVIPVDNRGLDNSSASFNPVSIGARLVPQGAGNMGPADFNVPALAADLVNLNDIFVMLTQNMELSENSMDKFKVSIEDVKKSVKEAVEGAALRGAVDVFRLMGEAAAGTGDLGKGILSILSGISSQLSQIFLMGAMAAFGKGYVELGTAYLIAAGVSAFAGGLFGGLSQTGGGGSAGGGSGRTSSGSSGRGGAVHAGDMVTINYNGDVFTTDEREATTLATVGAAGGNR